MGFDGGFVVVAGRCSEAYGRDLEIRGFGERAVAALFGGVD